MRQPGRRPLTYIAKQTGVEGIAIFGGACVIWLLVGIIELSRKPTMVWAIIAPALFMAGFGLILYAIRGRIYAKKVELTPEGIFVFTRNRSELISVDKVRSILYQENADGSNSWLYFKDGRHIVFSSPREAEALLAAISEATGLPFVHKRR